MRLSDRADADSEARGVPADMIGDGGVGGLRLDLRLQLPPDDGTRLWSTLSWLPNGVASVDGELGEPSVSVDPVQGAAGLRGVPVLRTIVRERVGGALFRAGLGSMVKVSRLFRALLRSCAQSGAAVRDRLPSVPQPRKETAGFRSIGSSPRGGARQERLPQARSPTLGALFAACAVIGRRQESYTHSGVPRAMAEAAPGGRASDGAAAPTTQHRRASWWQRSTPLKGRPLLQGLAGAAGSPPSQPGVPRMLQARQAGPPESSSGSDRKVDAGDGGAPGALGVCGWDAVAVSAAGGGGLTASK
jgi:hypothetical protein